MSTTIIDPGQTALVPLLVAAPFQVGGSNPALVSPFTAPGAGAPVLTPSLPVGPGITVSVAETATDPGTGLLYVSALSVTVPADVYQNGLGALNNGWQAACGYAQPWPGHSEYNPPFGLADLQSTGAFAVTYPWNPGTGGTGGTGTGTGGTGTGGTGTGTGGTGTGGTGTTGAGGTAWAQDPGCTGTDWSQDPSCTGTAWSQDGP